MVGIRVRKQRNGDNLKQDKKKKTSKDVVSVEAEANCFISIILHHIFQQKCQRGKIVHSKKLKLTVILWTVFQVTHNLPVAGEAGGQDSQCPSLSFVSSDKQIYLTLY